MIESALPRSIPAKGSAYEVAGPTPERVTNIFERKEGSTDPWLAYRQQAMIDARRSP